MGQRGFHRVNIFGGACSTENRAHTHLQLKCTEVWAWVDVKNIVEKSRPTLCSRVRLWTCHSHTKRQCPGNSTFGNLLSLWQDNYQRFSTKHLNQKIKMEKVKEQHGGCEQLMVLLLSFGDEGKTTNIIKNKLIKSTLLSLLSLSLNEME